tara:strand:- start:15605 stop:16219 length:615 start_codon:yes stop_codon:yes gene_type:complete
MAIAMVEFGFFSPMHLHGLGVDLSAISTSQTRSVFASGKHLHKFYDADGEKTSQVDVGGKYARTEGRDPTYSAGIGSAFFFPVGLIMESDFRYYQSHTTFAGGAGVGYRVFTFGAGTRIEFPDEGGRETFLRMLAVCRYTKKIKGREVSFVLKGEGLRSKGDNERIDYWTEARYRMGKHMNIGLRFERVRGDKTQAAVLGLSFL